MLDAFLAEENIVHVGAALYLVGFLFRDQVLLRAFVILGDLVYISYFYFAPQVPLWGGVFWSAVFMIVNAVMIFHILADRAPGHMSVEELQLFGFLETLSPGEFRQLIKLGNWRTAPEATVIAWENEPLENLYYVLEGAITIEKSGSAPRVIGPRAFIGEVAFLLPQPASATVTLAAGARYVVWNNAALRRQQMRAPALAIALSAALNKDMAMKVARS